MPIRTPRFAKRGCHVLGYQSLFIASSSYQRRIGSGIAYLLKDQRDPCQASGRTDPGVVSLSCILGVLGDCRATVSLVAADQVAVVGASGAESSGVVRQRFRDKGLDQTRMDLDHRSCRLAHRTLVLYSRNQSRTNIALCKENG